MVHSIVPEGKTQPSPKEWRYRGLRVQSTTYNERKQRGWVSHQQACLFDVHLFDEVGQVRVEPNGEQVKDQYAGAQAVIVEEQGRVPQQHRSNDAAAACGDQRNDEPRKELPFMPMQVYFRHVWVYMEYIQIKSKHLPFFLFSGEPRERDREAGRHTLPTRRMIAGWRKELLVR